MKTILALTGAALLALSVPALAQNAGAPGAIGTGGSLTGSNPGTGYGANGPLGDRINPGPGPTEAYPNSPGNGGRGYLDEGRASAPDSDMDNGGARVYRQPRGESDGE